MPDAAGLMLPVMTAGYPAHDLITLTGGAIGQGLPNAIGAAIACPKRPVVALIGDGTAMYTIQSLWTMAREQLGGTAIIFNNASYSVLNVELERVGAERIGAKARSQLDINGPRLDFARLAQGMGVHAARADTAEAFVKALEYALSIPARISSKPWFRNRSAVPNAASCPGCCAPCPHSRPASHAR